MDRHHAQRALADRNAVVEGVDDHAIASVDSNVGGAAVVDDDVARLDVVQGDRSTRGGLRLRGTRDGLTSLGCLLYTSPSPRDRTRSRMPSSA